MKKILLILPIPILVFLSCAKDKNESQVSPPASDTLSAGWEKIPINDSVGFLDVFFINNTGFTASTNIFKSTDGVTVGLHFHYLQKRFRRLFLISQWGVR
jgi:hypothetical protein